MILYWIHLRGQTDFHAEGYIGITSRSIKRRLYEHKTIGNDHLKYALKKYGDEVIVEVLLEGSEEYCKMIEEKLRPHDQIGWNVVKGGGVPPNSKGRKLSEKTKHKMRKPKPPGFGKGERNSMYGSKGAAFGKKWYHDPVTKYSKYFSPNCQPNGWIEGRFSRKKVNASSN